MIGRTYAYVHKMVQGDDDGNPEGDMRQLYTRIKLSGGYHDALLSNANTGRPRLDDIGATYRTPRLRAHRKYWAIVGEWVFVQWPHQEISFEQWYSTTLGC